VTGGGVVIHGPKGEKTVPILPFTTVTAKPEGVMVTVEASHKQARSNVGTMWSLVKNAIEGVNNGFKKVLEIEGVGYKAILDGKNLMLSLGYVNPVCFEIPEGITIVVEKNTVTITGTNFNPPAVNNVVRFNGVLATVTVATPNTLTTTVPSGATTGPISVTVNGVTVTSTQDFTVLGSPSITGFTPGSGAVAQIFFIPKFYF
ncbi:MAG: 50S ribosomal protein L6, partial [Chitinophagaceae bacterium]|nr:50S ribosomal protein L6 [Chitinophagaceae bacterium]